MEMEAGKLFIGGISWDTSEERLREYFQTFGEVVEAVIMKDRATGRGRGFGFVVFANASVAEIVVKERHVIDGRTVEAKKAVPRDDHKNFNRNNGGSIPGSPSPARTKKIFVGGLASSVTENDFKRYFDQFGTTADVVVMYDHNTQRPRGFGFITYDSEEAVDRVLFKTFHELNGKMVEVKRAVPKELSPGPTRNQSIGYNYGLNRMSSFLNSYSPGYSSTSPTGYGMRMDGRFSPFAVGRSGYPPYSPSNYSMSLNSDSLLSLNSGANADSGFAYGRGMNSYYSGHTDCVSSPIRYDGGVTGNGPMSNTSNQNLWGNGNLNYTTNSTVSNAFVASGNVNRDLVGGLGSIGEIWGSSPTSSQGGGVPFSSGNLGYGGRAGYGRNNVLDGNLYENKYFYGDEAWQPYSPEHERSTPFGRNNNVGYAGGYSIDGRSNRGIAA